MNARNTCVAASAWCFPRNMSRLNRFLTGNTNPYPYRNQEKAGRGSLAFSLVLSFGQCQKKEQMGYE